MQMGDAANNLNNNCRYNEKILFFYGIFSSFDFYGSLTCRRPCLHDQGSCMKGEANGAS